MTSELDKWRLALADKAREVMLLIGDCTELEERLARIKAGAIEEYNKIDEALDRDGRVPATKE